MKDNDIIREYIILQIEWSIKASNPIYKTAHLKKRCEKLEKELVDRKLLTTEDIEMINK